MGGTAAALYDAWPSAASNFAWAALGMHSIVRSYQLVREGRRRGPKTGELVAYAS